MALVTLLLIGGLMHAVRTFLPADMPDAALELITGTDLAFGFVLLSALFAGRACIPIRTPQLTGYLLAGVIAGPSVLGLLTGEMVGDLKLINGTAICLIALTAGGELNIRKMRPLMPIVRSMIGWAVLGTALLLAVVSYALRPLLPWLQALDPLAAAAFCAVLGVTLASQSPAVVMALLAETESDGAVSRVTLGVVVIADLIVIVLYAVVSAIAQAALGGEAGALSTAALVAWELLGSLAVGAVVGMVLGLYIRQVQRGVGLFVLMVCVVLAEAGVRAHLDPLIIMLAAGLFIENATSIDASKLIHDLESAALPVYLVFFAVAGATLDLVALWAVALPATVLAAVRGLGLLSGSRIAGHRAGAPAAVNKWVWSGLIPQAGLALALALIMERTFGALGTQAAVLVLAVVAINQLIGPVLMRVGLVKAGEVGQRERPDFAASSDEDAPVAPLATTPPPATEPTT